MKKIVHFQIYSVAQTGIRVERLKEYTVGVEVKKLVTLYIHTVAESGQVKRLKEYTVAVEVKSLSLFK